VRVRLTGAALIALVAIVAMAGAAGAPAGSKPSDSPGLLPDLRTVVPLSLGIQNQQQREYLRFANGIANTESHPDGSTSITSRSRARSSTLRVPSRAGTTSSRPRTTRGTYLEANYTNNRAWQAFDLTRDSSGNPKIALAGHSPCETPGLCGIGAPNR
jgi:hypothetical protein